MFNLLAKNFFRGLSFVKDNPQIIYTIFLIIIIPTAFVYSGKQFLDVASENQERLEKERISLMQDTFAEFVSTNLYDGKFLQERIESITAQNNTISDFKILSRYSDGYKIVASLNKEEIGDLEKDPEKLFMYRGAILDPGSSVIFPGFVNGKRHWKSVRAILNEFGDVDGVIFTDVSMEYIDEIAARNIRNAYYILFLIILSIFVLLIRQARVVDYAILYKKLKEVDKLKDDFISMAAHELKTPLTAIRGYVGLISTDKLNNDEKESINRVNISIGRLNDLIGDILDVSRIQQGRMKFSLKKVDPSEILQSVVDSYRQMAADKSLTLEYDNKPLPKILVDPDKFKQILINLIGNAIKYTPKGGVKITTEEDRKKKAKVLHIRISDTGFGISAEDQKKLFKRFSRIRNRETIDIGGTGLGLWITAKMVSGMKGDIKVESIKGKGSDFIVSFLIVK